MNERQGQPKPEAVWQKTPYSNLVRYVPSGVIFARFKSGGKLVRRSLKTDTLTVAQLRLADLQKEERRRSGQGQRRASGKFLFEDALAAYRERGFRPSKPKSKRDAKPLKPKALAYYEQISARLLKSWPALAKTEVRKLTESDCERWADKARGVWSPSVFNHTLGLFRHVIDLAIAKGAAYANPAAGLMRDSETPKELQLPTADQFESFVAEIERGGSGFSRPCADLVRFLAFGGFRLGEAKFATWADCDMERGEIIARGDPVTGLKNRKPGEVRRVPMIPEMRQLLERLRSERPDDAATARVMRVAECQKSMNRAAEAVGMARITHHDLRHLFATRCIESGVDVPTVAKWLGHRDGGALAMRVYGHLRDAHSTEMARRVSFNARPEGGLIPFQPKAEGAA